MPEQRPLREEDLVALIYDSSDLHFTKVVSLKDCHPKVFVNLERRTWSIDGQLAFETAQHPIGTSIYHRYPGYVIGVYDRTKLEDLSQMIDAAVTKFCCFDKP